MSTLKWKNSLLIDVNSFLLDKTQFHKGAQESKQAKQKCLPCKNLSSSL